MDIKGKASRFVSRCVCCAPTLNLGAADLRAIERETAIKLIPRLKA